MNQRAPTMPGKNEIELPGSMNPVLAMLAFLPIMAIILIGLALAVEKTPVLLMVLLIAVVGCCSVLSWTALRILLGGKLTFDDDGLTVHRFLTEERYPWASIEACKVMPATGTLGDNAMVELDDRAGVGLFVRGLDRKRDHDLDADIILCAGTKSHLQPLMQIANRVQSALKRAQEPAKRIPARSAQAGQRRQFRQRQTRPTASAPKVDPVAAFRNR